jgi:hypothetical protein
MSLQTSFMRPVCSAVAGFLGVMLIVMVFGLANKMGVIDGDLTKRTIGLAIGVMLVIIGNYLPKLRPLNWVRANSNSTANERLSGWILLLTGIVWIAFFTFAPLSQARHVSSLIAISALTMIAVNWTRLARKAFSDVRRQSVGTSFGELRGLLVGPRKIVGYLLFAFFFVVITSCVKFLIDEEQLTNKLTSWMLCVFGILYAGLFALLESMRARK